MAKRKPKPSFLGKGLAANAGNILKTRTNTIDSAVNKATASKRKKSK